MKALTVIALILMTLLIANCGGSIGMTGSKGDIGATGPQGDAGGCTVTSLPDNAGALIQCTDGSNSVVLNGTNGTNGVNGQNGQNGTNGTNGTNAQPVTMVKLCPNTTGSYPNSFPEYAFDVNNTLYATYWDGHNAWTAELYPGAYSSTSTSAPCNFTVNANGTIN